MYSLTFGIRVMLP